MENVTDSIPEAAGPSRTIARKQKAAFSAEQSLERIVPHSPDAEQGVFGCIFLDPVEAMDECVPRFGRECAFFYDPRHQLLWNVVLEFHEARKPIDMITLANDLHERGLTEMVGGFEYLNSLPDKVPSAANLAYYIEIVVEKYTMRKMIQSCTNTVARIYEHTGEVTELINEVERDILSVRAHMEPAEQEHIQAAADVVMGELEEELLRDGTLTGLPTGLPDLDEVILGLQNGETIIIAARPSVGKTSLAMNIAEHLAVDLGFPVGVFSLEMPKKQLIRRMIFARAGVSRKKYLRKECTEEERAALVKAQLEIRKAPLYIDDGSGQPILTIRSKARKMHRKYGIKLFMLDYLQLAHGLPRRGDNRQQEIADISGGCKEMAKELDVPVIVLSQLTREMIKGNKPRKPRLDDLRESGAIEQDADTVALLYLKRNDEEETGMSYEVVPVGCIIAKQRNGETTEIDLVFNKPVTRYACAPKVEDRDVPVDQDPLL